MFAACEADEWSRNCLFDSALLPYNLVQVHTVCLLKENGGKGEEGTSAFPHWGPKFPSLEIISAQSGFPTNTFCPLGLCSLGSQMRLEVMKELKTRGVG